MTSYEIEEKMDTISYIVDVLDTATRCLEGISPNNEYSLALGKLTEVVDDLDYELNSLGEKYETFSELEMQENKLERAQREFEYRQMQGF